MFRGDEMSETSLKANPQFDPMLGGKWVAAFASLGLVSIPLTFGIRLEAAISIGFLVAFAVVGWLPLTLLVTYVNWPEVILKPESVSVQSWHRVTRAAIVPYSRCRWSIDERQRLVLRMFPMILAFITLGSRPPKLVFNLRDSEREAWISRLREKGAPEIRE